LPESARKSPPVSPNSRCREPTDRERMQIPRPRASAMSGSLESRSTGEKTRRMNQCPV
jgi:hypothetical protein